MPVLIVRGVLIPLLSRADIGPTTVSPGTQDERKSAPIETAQLPLPNFVHPGGWDDTFKGPYVPLKAASGSPQEAFPALGTLTH